MGRILTVAASFISESFKLDKVRYISKFAKDHKFTACAVFEKLEERPFHWQRIRDHLGIKDAARSRKGF